MRLAVLCVAAALATATPTLKFKSSDGLANCEMSKGVDSDNAPFIDSSCGLSINGDSYFNGKIRVDGHSDLRAWIQTIADEVATATSNIATINSELSAAKTDMGKFQQDVVAETMCAGLVGWDYDSRTISGNEAGYDAKTCSEVCTEYGAQTW